MSNWKYTPARRDAGGPIKLKAKRYSMHIRGCGAVLQDVSSPVGIVQWILYLQRNKIDHDCWAPCDKHRSAGSLPDCKECRVVSTYDRASDPEYPTWAAEQLSRSSQSVGTPPGKSSLSSRRRPKRAAGSAPLFARLEDPASQAD